MNDITTSFEKLVGRQPSDEERQRLWQVKDALGIGANDALWLVLIALEHYRTLYAQIPEQLAEATAQSLRNFQSAADATAAAAAEETKRKLAGAIATTSREVARSVATKQRAQWVAAAAIACCLALTVSGWVMYTRGKDAGIERGYAAGYEAARDEKAASSWAASPSGRRAYGLAQAGSIDALSACSRPGWKVRDGVCHPEAAPDGLIYGWRVR